MQKLYKAKTKSKSKNTTKKHKQRIYAMRGCSNKCGHGHGNGYGNRHIHLGGNNSAVLATSSKAIGADFNLAYPYNGAVVRNDALAYTGKGGYKSENPLFPEPSNLAVVATSNVNGANPLYPNTGPPFNGFNFLNPVNQQRGGSCGCGGLPFMKGGSCGCGGAPFMKAGSGTGNHNHRHRHGCKCSTCKMNSSAMMTGGGGCATGNNGIPYPNGLVGSAYVNSSNLPGANGISGDANYYSNNTYNNDVSRQMVNVGANPPFLGFLSGLKGGRSKHGRRHTHIRTHINTKKHRKHRGGSLSNFLGQDLINLGRQLGHGVGTTFNALNGYPASANPLPWKDQLVGKH
jgi:hypothetical protein